MRFEFKVASRYLVASWRQSVLLALGVSIGVIVFTFIAALINGLGARLIDDVTGNVAHVVLEPAPRLPAVFMQPTGHQALVAVQPGTEVQPVIRTARPLVALAQQVAGVRAVVPEAVGNATLTRGQKDVAVAITGIEQGFANTIAPLEAYMVRGRLVLGAGEIVVGNRLARELAIDVGDRVVMRAARPSQRGTAVATQVVTVRGVFALGVQAVDERTVYMDLSAARTLLGLGDGVSLIEVKVDDVWAAPRIADELARVTGLKASHWVARNERLQEGLRAQASSADMIKAFSLLTIAIGVASALYLSVSRRRSEIGIMRSFGIGRGVIVRTFVIQGLLIGLTGALIGAALGYGFAEVLLLVTRRPSGMASMPIDPAQGEYLRAIVLATAASAIAAVLPARAAAKIDPLQAIQA